MTEKPRKRRSRSKQLVCARCRGDVTGWRREVNGAIYCSWYCATRHRQASAPAGSATSPPHFVAPGS
jgi:hypothetical protein